MWLAEHEYGFLITKVEPRQSKAGFSFLHVELQSLNLDASFGLTVRCAYPLQDQWLGKLKRLMMACIGTPLPSFSFELVSTLIDSRIKAKLREVTAANGRVFWSVYDEQPWSTVPTDLTNKQLEFELVSLDKTIVDAQTRIGLILDVLKARK